MAIGEQLVSREELLGRAQAMLPQIKARAGETEKLRQIPQATVDELKASGLMRVANPERYGGYGYDVDLYFDIAMELGTACGSTAWCYSVWSSHNWMIGHWPEEAQDEYFAGGPDVLSSSAFAMLGRLQPIDGGFRLSGRWDFSSGSDAGHWAMLGAIGPAGPCMALVERSDYEVLDTWFVSGLRGTGSKDIQVADAFVPAHRVATILGPMDNSPGYALHGRASYRLPTMSIMPFTLCSPLVGMAQGALNEFIDSLRGKMGRGRTAESVAVQLRIAESSAEIDAARLLVRTTSRDLIDRAARGELPDEMTQATARRNYGYVTKLCLQAVNRLFEAGGGHSLFETQALQRFHRDVHAGSHQIALYWDAIGEGYGRAALGLPPTNPFG
ncbi:MAG TPA: acyl-CoA dehydrogenase family protein [Dehalococcoidia bacterium]|nr:acyl-CoA dehydrogenase family protein [Dehalococcoidia bacterium]